MVSSSRKISCSLARIRSSFEYCLPVIPVMISTSRKKALIKKECLNQTVYKSREKDFLKTKFSLYGKAASTLKNLGKNGRKWFPLARKSITLVKTWPFFKNQLLLFSATVSTTMKKLRKKENSSTTQKIHFHQSERRISLKDTFLPDGKTRWQGFLKN